jgi:hypothetical protein
MMDSAEARRKLEWAETVAEGGTVRDTVRVQALVEVGEQIRASNLIALAARAEDQERDELLDEARAIVLGTTPVPDTEPPASE